ncbi:zinc ribbon domain-containing protein [Kineothrix sp. MSJ-39]|uniref:zinc ribbon domain-containing protein n=1 Tax=Kineothrix sp. MSJ-39 TaxID=2841533 RepID=UPI001C107602|nr:zinc ribbon domain-containing protein [Kineothrix sp. MSJ-39]MBU5428736.1 zinc ribbon domain-containing protein [Kineothrix sp. MSJ-39]
MKSIIILVLILVIILTIYILIFLAKKKAKEVTRDLFGTDDIRKAAQQMKQEYATTPKSVNAMTSLLLPRIVADFPDFTYDEMKNRAEDVLVSYLRAIDQNNSSLLKEGNQELQDQLSHHLQMLSDQNLIEQYDDIRIHRTEISQYKKNAGRCVVTFQTSLACMHYRKNAEGRITEGSTEYTYQTRFNTDLIYIQNREIVEKESDRALGINCPNCGAPISSLGAKFCEYCGSAIVELNIHAWSFSHIEECK